MSRRRWFVLCLTPYVGWLAFAYQYHFIDGANLLFHEAGHVLFGLFGEWPHFLGGSLAQVMIPALAVMYFLHHAQQFEAAVCGIWLGESLLYLAAYMADARDQLLPLLGGHIHDWNWMLGRLGLLEECRTLAELVRALAVICLLACLMAAWRWSAPWSTVRTAAEAIAEKRRRRWARARRPGT